VHGIHVNHARNTCSDDSRTIATGSTFGSRIGPSEPTTGSVSGFGQIPVVFGSPLLGYRELYESNLFVSLPNDGACHGVYAFCVHTAGRPSVCWRCCAWWYLWKWCWWRASVWLADWLYNCLACCLAVVVVIVTDTDDCIIIPSINIHHFTSLTLRLCSRQQPTSFARTVCDLFRSFRCCWRITKAGRAPGTGATWRWVREYPALFLSCVM
jgi:hypothetical protein